MHAPWLSPRLQVTVVDDHKIVVNDILNENVDELPEFRDRVIKVSLGGCSHAHAHMHMHAHTRNLSLSLTHTHTHRTRTRTHTQRYIHAQVGAHPYSQSDRLHATEEPTPTP